MSRLPPGQRLYVVGDVHGRADLLDELLDLIAADMERRGMAQEQRIVCLGDLIDRGPSSRAVVERVMGPMPGAATAVALLGNHERMLLDAVADTEALEGWLVYNGGVQTLLSYDIDPPSQRELRNGWSLADRLPAAHLDFLGGLLLSMTVGDYFLVHAGVRPGVPFDAQSPLDLVWMREPFLSHDSSLERMVVHGHTPRAAPEIRPHRIGIDTGAWFSGRLTALVLEGEARAFLHTGKQ